MNVDTVAAAAESRPKQARPSAAKSWLKAIERTSRIESEPKLLFADIVDGFAAQQPQHPALLSDVGTLSYAELAQRINRYARWALRAGIRRGDTVCLFLPNCPDYIAAWLGISRVGGVAALINTKLVGMSLAHCVNVAEADHVILATDLADVFEAALPYLGREPKIWLHGGDQADAAEPAEALDNIIAAMDGGPLM